MPSVPVCCRSVVSAQGERSEGVQPIRQRITEILKECGTATVAELADQLDMAQVSVRHHLDILIGEDLVQCSGVRRRNGAGRPSQVYALTPQAMKLFPQRHAALAGEILVQMKSLLSEDEVRDLLRRIAEKNAREAPEPVPGQSIEERLSSISEFLTEKGYNARWELRDGHYELYACNCPYMGVSDEHVELCTMDQAFIRELIPQAVRKRSRALDGAIHCAYAIEITAQDGPVRAEDCIDVT
jgi:predicted ArsR family transcriptional regulator